MRPTIARVIGDGDEIYFIIARVPEADAQDLAQKLRTAFPLTDVQGQFTNGIADIYMRRGNYCKVWLAVTAADVRRVIEQGLPGVSLTS